MSGPPDRDACSLRLFRIPEFLVAYAHRIASSGTGAVTRSATSILLRPGVAQVFAIDPERFGDHKRYQHLNWRVPMLDLPAILLRGRFDVAWLSVYDVAQRYVPVIRRHSPATRVIVDSTDVNWAREHRGAELADDHFALAGAQHTRGRERAVFQTADLNIAISEPDAPRASSLPRCRAQWFLWSSRSTSESRLTLPTIREATFRTSHCHRDDAHDSAAVLRQAGPAMLAQANSRPQLVLKLSTR